jgi:hypothetical protein
MAATLNVSRSIEPQRFVVRRVDCDAESSARISGWLVAAADRTALGGFSPVVYTTVLRLSSTAQTPVRSLQRSRKDEPRVGVHVSVAQIRRALGDWMTLTLTDRQAVEKQPAGAGYGHSTRESNTNVFDST